MGWAFNSALRRKAKFGNKKAKSTDGRSFPSMLERSVYELLKQLEQRGEIKILQLQANVFLTPAKIRSIPDFKCLDLKTGLEFFVEAKGVEGERWKLIKKLWPFFGPADLHVYKGTHARPLLHEVIKGNA